MGDGGRGEAADAAGPQPSDLLLASIPLMRLDEQRNPVRPASCCVVDYRSRRVLLTVQHGAGDGGEWFALERFEPGAGMRLHPGRGLHLLVQGNLGGDIGLVDFAFVEVRPDFAPVWQRITVLGGIEETWPRTILRTDLAAVAKEGVPYGFAGVVQVERTRTGELFGDVQCETGLTLLGEDDEWVYFALNHPHPGHEFYEGCSGAPILDSEGNLVALVAGPGKERDSVRAVPLRRYRTALELSLGLEPGGPGALRGNLPASRSAGSGQ